MYFGMSVSPSYLEATVTTAAVARERPDLEMLVNISQMTVSQMSLTEMTDFSPAAAAVALRASAELVRIARRQCTTHGLSPASLFLGMGGGIDYQGLDDSAAVWDRTHFADRREGCG